MVLLSVLHIRNSRPYEFNLKTNWTDSTLLTPLQIVFLNSEFRSGFLNDVHIDEEVLIHLQECGIHHLLMVIPERYSTNADELELNREADLEAYEDIFRAKRKAIRELEK